MKGLRLTIAKQTVSSILDTLGDDDFFNIITVSVPALCFLCTLGLCVVAVGCAMSGDQRIKLSYVHVLITDSGQVEDGSSRGWECYRMHCFL